MAKQTVEVLNKIMIYKLCGW